MGVGKVACLVLARNEGDVCIIAADLDPVPADGNNNVTGRLEGRIEW